MNSVFINSPRGRPGTILCVSEEFWHWKFHYFCDDFSFDELYNWCLDNLGANLNWHVVFNGVVLYREEDSVLFALRWC